MWNEILFKILWIVILIVCFFGGRLSLVGIVMVSSLIIGMILWNIYIVLLIIGIRLLKLVKYKCNVYYIMWLEYVIGKF